MSLSFFGEMCDFMWGTSKCRWCSEGAIVAVFWGFCVSRWNESRAGGDTLLMSGGVQADNATIRLIAPVLGLQTW